MKKLFFAILIMLSSGIWGQTETSKDFSYGLSSPYETFDAYRKNYFSRDGEMLAVKFSGPNIIIQKFKSGNLNLSKDNVSEWPKGMGYQGIIEFNDHIYMFFSLWDKNSANEQMFIREIDFNSGTFTGEPELLFQISGKLEMPYQVKFSKDQSKIVFRAKKELLEENDVMCIQVFNKDMEHEWDEEIKIPHSKFRTKYLDMSINSKGNVHMLISVRTNDDGWKLIDSKGNNLYNIETLQINEGGIQSAPDVIRINGNFINDVWFQEDKEGAMMCAGYYGNIEANGASGIFIGKLDDDGKINDLKTFKIPLSVLNDYASAKEKKKYSKDKEVYLRQLRLRKFETTDDGGVVIIGEVNFSAGTSPGTASNKAFHEEVLIAKVDSNGELAWMKKIPKKQRATIAHFEVSLKYHEGKNAHYILFVDNPNNKTLTKDQCPETYTGSGGVLTGFKIEDADGEMSRVSFFDINKVNGVGIYNFNI